MAKHRELTPQQFMSALKTYVEKRFAPVFVESRLTEVQNDLRAVLGTAGWENDIMQPWDLATIHQILLKRIPVLGLEEDMLARRERQALADCIRECAIESFGMRESELAKDRANQMLVEQRTSLTAEPSIAGIDTSALTGTYFRSRNSLHNPPSPDDARFAPPPARERILKKKPEPRVKKEVLPSSHGLDAMWQKIQAYAQAQGAEPDGITQFIAPGASSALKLSPNEFERKLSTARQSLSWNEMDSKAGQALLDSLATAFKKARAHANTKEAFLK